ncbi:MAG TPA: MbcA/ParS/Xre antitoxin family protein [Bryobacteraceae bacterium]|jgi:uncharacterized protein (DUF2384 family)|nr:MbcA/ParS/Xre antitoxin family protein [Bryobacteraceae bacterium]
MDTPFKNTIGANSGRSGAPPLAESNPGREEVRRHVWETFGTEDKALHWLGRPNPLFGGRTPAEVLEIEPDAVEQELVRIDHGIFV